MFYIASSEPVVFVFDYGDNVELWKAEAKEEDEAKDEEEVKAGGVLVVLGSGGLELPKKLCKVRNSWRGSYEYPESRPATQTINRIS